MRTKREGDTLSESLPATRHETHPEDVTPTRVRSHPEDATPTRLHARPEDATPTRRLDAAAPGTAPGAATTPPTQPTGPGTSPHGNRLGPQLRRLPQELEARYAPLRDLAGGAQADLIVAEDRETGREVVIKLYRAPGNPYDLATSTKLDRADAAHVVRVLDRGTSHGHAWEVQEYCAHGSMLDVPGLRGRLSSARFRAVVAELGEALVHLHGLSIVHRDLKPANVLVRGLDPLSLVLTDFGLSTEVLMSKDIGSVAGTFPYMPPEAYYGEIGSPGDWWALGAMAYELLAGRHFLADASGRMPSEARIRHAVATGDYTVARVGDDRQWLLLRGLLTRDRKTRWGGAQFREWLAGGSPVVATEADPPTQRLPGPPPDAGPAPTRRLPPPPAQPPPAQPTPSSSEVFAEEYAQLLQRQQEHEREQAREARRLARRATEQGLRRQWWHSLVGRTLARSVWAAVWSVGAGSLLLAWMVVSGSPMDLIQGTDRLSTAFTRYVPAALIAVAAATLVEALFLRRQWPNRTLGLVSATLGLAGTFSFDGAFLGLPVDVPLFFVGGWSLSLFLGWITSWLGQTHPNGVPLSRGDANTRRPRTARLLMPLAHLGGAVVGGVGLASWFFTVVPYPGGASAVIDRLAILTVPSSWLTQAIPQLDVLGLADDPIHLTMLGLLGYVLALTANDLHRLAPSLIWVGIAGALLAALIVVFAVPALLPLAALPGLIALFTIRWTERAPASPPYLYA